MKKKVLFFVLILGFTIKLYSQVTLKGEVLIGGQRTHLSFANVALCAFTDTTRIVAGIVTDTQGYYVLPNIEVGRYKIMISCVGYKTLCENIRINMPSTGTELIRNYVIEEDATVLETVLVEGSRIKQYVDRVGYTFSVEQVKKARYSRDLLESISQLSIDRISNKLEKSGGGSVQILINGVNATDNDLKMIPPEKVVKVDYYDIPPARYVAAGVLVNVITKRMDSGWGGGFDVDHAFTTGFGNDNVFLRYNVGANQFAFDYDLSYRNYRDREIKTNYYFRLDDTDYSYLSDESNRFGYTANKVNFKYTNQQIDNHTFQLKFSPNFETKFSQSDTRIELNGNEKRVGVKDNQSHTFGPVLDLYFSKKIKCDQELLFNIVGTIYRSSQDKTNEETGVNNENFYFNDEMKLKNSKESIIGELYYTKKHKCLDFNLGYQGNYFTSRSILNNYLSERENVQYTSSGSTQYLYAELAATRKKILYRFSLGGTMLYSQNSVKKYTDFSFSPRVIIGYLINSNSRLRLALQSQSAIPTIAKLSNNAEFIAEHLLRRGNPYLVNEDSYGGGISYNYQNKLLDVNFAMFMSYVNDPINEYFEIQKIRGEKYMVYTSENANNSWYYGCYSAFALRPFKNDMLTIKGSGYIMKQEINSSIVGKYSHWRVPIDYSIDFKYKDFAFQYKGRIVSRQLDGTYLKDDENYRGLYGFYQRKNIRFSLGCLWLFTPSKYFKTTIANSLVRSTEQSVIKDNKSMITVGFSWNFNSDKSYKAERKLQNQDRDTGLF